MKIQQQGYSLIEIVIVLAVFSVVMMGTMPILKNTILQQKRFEAKADIKSHQRILEKVMQKSFLAVRPEHFEKNETYVFDTNLVSDTNVMGLNGKIIPPFEETLAVDFRTSGFEGSSFVDSAINIPPALYPFRLNSFTLGVMKVDMTGSRKLEGSLSRILAARCIQNGDAMQGEGATIDLSAPIKSTMRVLSEHRYPFIQSNGDKLSVHCCRIDQTNCGRTYPQFIPKIYSIFLENGIPKAIQEFPSAGNKESMGSGFVLTFSRQSDANYFRAIYFDLENKCQLTLSGTQTCGDNNPGLYLKAGDALSLDKSIIENFVITRSFIRFGRVKKGFESSGVIVLGE